ncbi:MAG: aspartate/glutamate racemase family protein [Phycisphaeraceae bacterium]|nr:aspartate/glutamate racemase family protein [Phycisphaeraceae bacterium]MCW5763333.1 aspartate/glutamate racemase family protein [Phycisphaeraceae bacterium]
MAKHIGMVGISPVGAALCYRQLFRHARANLPPHEHPAFTMHSLPLHGFLEAVRRDDWHRVAALLRQSVDILANAGAQICFTPDNMVQHALPLIARNSPIPWISMAETVAETISKDGRTLVGIIGTTIVTSGSTYQAHLGVKGIRIHKPQHDEADTIQRIILEQLVHGVLDDASLDALHAIVVQMKERGCDAVLFGCSEAPLLVEKGDWALPVYDSNDIVAREVFNRSTQP